MKIGLHIPKVHDMTIDTVDVISTSAVTADVSPVVLSQTEMIRLKFCPTLVDNEKDPHKSVSGKFLYEKKRKNDAAFPSDDNGSVVKISRGSVKVGNWMELNLSTSETYELYQGLKRLYALYEDMGEIPYGSATYTRVDSSFRQFLSIIQNDPSAARMIGNEENYDLVKTLLSLSQNVALIEIKTPCTELIGNQYRGTYSFSYDLSGAVNQVLNYRDKLTKEYYSLCHQGSEPFEVLSPKCVVIIGKMASLTPGQVAAFENFRNSLGNVLILTFDELYQRIVDLISVLSESPAQEQNSIEQNDNADELPF